MVPASDRAVPVAVLLLVVVLVGVVHPSVNALPGFSDHTGPTDVQVTGFERLDSGCAADIATRTRSTQADGNYTRVGFVETARADAALSVRAVRTSPAGADLSTFRVDVEPHATGPVNDTCQTGVLYELTVETSGGSGPGLLPDAHGTRVRWLHDGESAGCSASVTSPLDAECERFVDTPRRTWANATG